MAKTKYSPPLNRPYKETSYFWFRGKTFHDGLDLAPLPGHDMLLRYMTAGRILAEGWNNISGWWVQYEMNIFDGRKWVAEYHHMAHRSPHRAGDKVDVGQWAGTIGATGASTGNHVHIRMKVDFGLGIQPNMFVDPKIYMEQLELINKFAPWK